MPQFVRPADGLITFTITPPAGLSSVTLHTTTTMPGFLIEETQSSLQPPVSSLSYIYDAPKVAKDFPNLDLSDADGYAGADQVTISMLLSGTDASGARKQFAREVVIQGEEIQMPDRRSKTPAGRKSHMDSRFLGAPGIGA